jgi:poly(3-hydroxybutyrate) depolymerase
MLDLLPRPFNQKMRGESVPIITWENCKDETTVALWLIKGWGHVWPGTYTADLADDDLLKKFDAAKIIWDFFKSRRR